MTQEAAQRVESDMQITNLAGRNISVGKPTTTAKNAKPIEPNNKYIACVARCRNAALNGPKSPCTSERDRLHQG
jgi:hypothetical protein